MNAKQQIRFILVKTNDSKDLHGSSATTKSSLFLSMALISKPRQYNLDLAILTPFVPFAYIFFLHTSILYPQANYVT